MGNVRDSIPTAKRLRERMQLPMYDKGSKRYSTIWIDDRGTCEGQHVLVDGLFHRYQDAAGRLYMIRCPAQLSEEEQLRAIPDIPAGNVAMKISAMANERRAQKADDASDLDSARF